LLPKQAATPRLTANPVINAPEDTRADFLARVYGHIGMAGAIFLAVEVLLFMSGLAERIHSFTFGSGNRMTWLLVLGGFMIASTMATKSAHKVDNISAQYGGLVGIAVAEAVLFAPMLWVANTRETAGVNTIATAGVVTVIAIAGLTAVGYFTRRDLSPMRKYVSWGMMLALAAIAGALIFGFNLGLWFSVAMVGLAGSSILVKTQEVVRHYPANAHVGAAVQLFASFMLLFWYVLRIFLSFSSSD